MTCSKTRLYKYVVKKLKSNGFEGDYLDSVKKNLIALYNSNDQIYRDFTIPCLAAAFIWHGTLQGNEYWSNVNRNTQNA